MANNPNYVKYHPKWYRRRIPIFWWVHKWPHAKFILRELTSVAVGLYALVLLAHVWALGRGPETYATLLDWLKTPFSIIMHLIAFLFILFHSVTWFSLAPKALVFRVGKIRIPDALIAASNYLAWAFFTIILAWVILGD